MLFGIDDIDMNFNKINVHIFFSFSDWITMFLFHFSMFQTNPGIIREVAIVGQANDEA